MRAPPDRDSACEQRAAGSGELEPATAPVVRIDYHCDEAAPLERLERGGQRRAVRAEIDATAPMVGGVGWFSVIIIEYWPLVRPSGRSASSKRRASARAARCR